MQPEDTDAHRDYGPDWLPYPVPYDGPPDAARNAHREFYWQVYDYNNYRCPDCGRSTAAVERFEVHHLDRDPRNGRLSNLVAVCKRCHTWRHGSPNLSAWSVEEWKEGFVDPDYHPVYNSEPTDSVG